MKKNGNLEGKYYKEYRNNIEKYMNSFENIEEQIKNISIGRNKGLEALLFNPLTKKLYKMVDNYVLDHSYNNTETYYTVAEQLPKLFKLTNSMEVIGAEENVKKIGDHGFVAIANHQYHLDPFFTSCAFVTDYEIKKIRWVSKQGNFENPLFRQVLNVFGVIPLFNVFNNHGHGFGPDPNISYKITIKAQEEIKKTLNEKEGVGIFPEGTRNRRYPYLPLKKFQTGAAIICSGGLPGIKEIPPYIPAGLSGVRQPGLGKVTIRVGEPVYLNPEIFDLKDRTGLEEASEYMRKQVLALMRGKRVPKNKHELKQ